MTEPTASTEIIETIEETTTTKTDTIADNNIINNNNNNMTSPINNSNNNLNSLFGSLNANPLLNTPEDNDLLVKSVAEGYSHYLGYSQSTNDQAKNIDDTIEYMLARIDEFGAFVETIQTDSNKTESKLIPLLLEKTQEVQQLFPIIDKLVELSGNINKNITVLEDRLNQADKHISNLTGKSNPLKWVLSHIQKEEDILQQIKNSQEQNQNVPKFEPINIHNTTEFFKQLRNQAQPNSNNSTNNNNNNNITQDQITKE